MAGEEKTGIQKENLDISIWVKSGNRTIHMITGDMGESDYMTSWDYQNSKNVAHIIWVVLPRSMLLYVTSAAIFVPLGIYMGTRAAAVESKRLDKFIQLLGTVGASSPMWWFGIIIFGIFGTSLGWFPVSGAYPTGVTGFRYYLGIMYRMVLPVAVIVFVSLGSLAVISRKMVGEELTNQYVIASRSQGLPEKDIVYGRVLKSASPVILSRGIYSYLNAIPHFIILEIIYGWPGMGLLLYYSMGLGGRYGRPEDPPIVIGLIFVLAVIYGVGNIILELLYGYLDPRISIDDDVDKR